MSELSNWIRSVSWDDDTVRLKFMSTCSRDELFNLIEYLRDLIDKDYKQPKYNPYTFVPNNELSGTGGCSEIGCKLRRAKKFATFSAVYADDVFLQLQLITDEHFDMWEPSLMDNESFDKLKDAFNCDISVILTYLPLIEEGIVHIEPVRKLYCKKCFQRQLLQRNDLVDYSPIVKYVKDRVVIDVTESRRKLDYMFVELKNIDDYFDGENQILVVSGEEFRKLSNGDKKVGKKNVSREYWSKLIDDFVEKEFVSSCYYTKYCRDNDAKLITSKPSDGLFASITRGENAEEVLATYKNLPQYDMPFISNISIENALRLRKLEYEAFDRYRIALDKAVKEQCKTNSKVEWKDIYNDILYPEYNHLDLKLRNIKSENFVKTFGEILLLGGTITAGILTGFPIVTELAVTAGTALGAHLLAHKAENNIKLRENDYYYLWRLSKESIH